MGILTPATIDAMLSLLLILSTAFANNYFINPRLVDVYDRQNKTHQLVFSGTLDMGQCKLDEIRCQDSVVVMKAQFVMEPNEDALEVNNAIMMCSSESLPPQFNNAYHNGASNCVLANEYFQQTMVAFNLPLPEPKVPKHSDRQTSIFVLHNFATTFP